MNTTAPIQKSTATSILSKENIHLAIAFVLLFLWFHTAIDKFADLWTFEVNLGRQPLPKWSIKPLTYVVPGVELLTGILLFLPKTRKYGFWVQLYYCSYLRSM
ncbi:MULTISPECIES: MauE/DoxX family redox-associated membrane protein [Sphingobacterium]|uniref:MauE/DoxX family redox-associated membrane protein n=1 Tax=Sphingobacterium TaxID=28453 RepID=UPI0013DCE783|nr:MULTISPECIES: MauE/DoxX family redox-associated membrane protein [unclassified Sphingobacterium]